MKRAEIEDIIDLLYREDLTQVEAEEIHNEFRKFNDRMLAGEIPDDISLDDLPPFDDENMKQGEEIYKKSIADKQDFVAGQDMAELGSTLLQLKYAAFLQYKMEDGFIAFCENIKKRALAEGDNKTFKSAEKEIKRMMKSKGNFFKH